MDVHDCYERCVQGTAWLAPFLAALSQQERSDGDASGRAAAEPRVLHEHFSGTAALCRRWIADGERLGAARSAVAVDLDGAVLRVAQRKAREEGVDGSIEFVCADVIFGGGGAGAAGRPAADILFVGNFSIGYIHRRDVLVEYLKRCHATLRGSGGVFVCDTFDGESSFREGGVTRLVPVESEAGTHIRYTWEQRDADRLTSMVTCVLHFQVERGGEVIALHADAFVYRWRRWSIAELREAMTEAGFSASRVFQRLGEDAEPLRHGRELQEPGIVCIVASV